MLVFALALGVILAVVAVPAIWIAFGSWRVMSRAILAITAASGGAILFCAISGELDAEWLGLMWLAVVTITAMFAIVHWLGYRLVGTATHPRTRLDQTQFSLAQLMALMAAVAVTAAVARLMRLRIPRLDELLFSLAIVIPAGTLALVGAWATLRPPAIQFRIEIFALLALIMSGVVYYEMEVMQQDPGSVWASVFIVYSITLTLFLLFARSRGFRLLRGSELNPCAQLATEQPQD